MLLSVVIACSDRSNPRDVIVNSSANVPPQIRIVGDDSDVGSVVYVDGKEMATIASSFLGIPQVYVPVSVGKRVVEIKQKGQLLLRQTIDVNAESGVIGLPARASYNQP
jgi:riboflavin biosynthesis pyrimidine reductase